MQAAHTLGFSGSSAGKESTWIDPWVRKIPWRKDRLPTPVFLGFPGGSGSEESSCNAGDLGSIHGLGRSPGEGKGYPLQYSALENSMDCIVHGVAKSQTQLNDFPFTFMPHETYLTEVRITWLWEQNGEFILSGVIRRLHQGAYT